MSLQPIGILTILIGMLCLVLNFRATYFTLIVLTLFGAAAALFVSGTNIQPAYLFLAFVAAAALARSGLPAAAMKSVGRGRPGFWLLCLTVYGISTAFLIPSLMAGTTSIVPLGASEYASTGSTVPLGPVSSNITQSIYMAGDLLCFAITVALASSHLGFRTITAAMLAFAAGNVLMAILDLGTYATGTASLLNFMRNAQYTLHLDEEVSGLRRIVGSFPEASSFGRATLGALGFTGTLWLCGKRPAITGPLALASLTLVVLSTSSTGLAGTPLVIALLYATALKRSGFHPERPFTSAAALCIPLLLTAIVLAVLLDDRATDVASSYIDTLLVDKSSSSSGVERGSWNTFALENFTDTYGLGVGLGTVRTSSLPVALISNIGVPGTVLYVLFIVATLFGRRNAPVSFEADVQLAARNACIALLIGDSFAAPSVDQGLLFYAMAGLACTMPQTELGPVSVPSAHLTGARA